MMYRIGEFAKMAKVSIQTLRYYDEIDLFKPIDVDLFTNYRYYSDSQLKDLELIDMLKKVGFSLEEIRDNWDNLTDELLLEKKKKILDEIELKYKMVKKIDELRSMATNGGINRGVKENNDIKMKTIYSKKGMR